VLYCFRLRVARVDVNRVVWEVRLIQQGHLRRHTSWTIYTARLGRKRDAAAAAGDREMAMNWRISLLSGRNSWKGLIYTEILEGGGLD
jgi:hypothetical protein